jgi:DNA-binding NarL/FixJ family response regulator
MYRIFGLEPSETVPTRDFILELAHPLDRSRVMRYVDMIRTSPDPPVIEYRILPPGRGIRYLRSTITQVEDRRGVVTRVMGVAQDITDEQIARWDVAAHVAVVTALADWEGFDQGGTEILRALGEACEFAVGMLWIPSGETLTARAMWTRAGLTIDEFRAATFDLSVARGVGLVGTAWQSMHPEILLDATEEPAYRRVAAARQSGLRGAIAVPAVKGDEVLAVLEFHLEEEFLSGRLGPAIAAIGNELGAFLAQRRGQLDGQVLTPRELQVLKSSALGNTVSQVADELSIGHATVKTHLENIYRKLGVPDRAAAVAQALRLGLFE